jgi:hypothetical protein
LFPEFIPTGGAEFLGSRDGPIPSRSRHDSQRARP